jgi:HD-GYP domain-containing protein (c-di-GMP phosphodiesterase class II)
MANTQPLLLNKNKNISPFNIVLLRKHMRSVADIAYRVSLICGFSKKTSVKIYKASLHHDVGKFYWYDELFTKPNKLLNQLDKEYIYRHPEYSVKYLQYAMPRWAYNEYLKSDISIIDLIMLHHEKPDGSGYYRIKNIPKEAVVISFADIFSACIEFRQYKPSMSCSMALNLGLADFKDVFTKEEVKLIKTDLQF